MRTFLLTLLFVPTFAAAQSGTPAAAQAAPVRRLTVDEAVQIALDNNLGIQVARIDPVIQDLAVAQARAAWYPTFTSSMQAASIDAPSNSFLSGAQGPKTSEDFFDTDLGIVQLLRWGGAYEVGWVGSRSTTTNIFSNFSPQLRSSMSFNYNQPLLRNFSIDALRQRFLVSQKDREIADLTFRESVVLTARAVRHAYWDLAFAIASLRVHGQSLELARESLRNTRARVEIGTLAPVDVVEAEAEVSQREEAVIVAEALIDTTQDVLRALVFDPSMPDFWTLRIDPVSRPSLEIRLIDGEAAVRTAFADRTDLRQSQKNLEATDIDLRYFGNQTLPDLTASFDYGLAGLGGIQLLRDAGFPGPIIGQVERGFGNVLRDLFVNSFPTWTATISISYPLGATPQEAELARTRLERNRQQADLPPAGAAGRNRGS